jgi:hypothetical protein
MRRPCASGKVKPHSLLSVAQFISSQIRRRTLGGALPSEGILSYQLPGLPGLFATVAERFWASGPPTMLWTQVGPQTHLRACLGWRHPYP